MGQKNVDQFVSFISFRAVPCEERRAQVDGNCENFQLNQSNVSAAVAAATVVVVATAGRHQPEEVLLGAETRAANQVAPADRRRRRRQQRERRAQRVELADQRGQCD